MTVVTRYMAYRTEDGLILGSSTGYWADEAAAQANCDFSFGQYKPATIYVLAQGEQVPDAFLYFVQNGVITPLPDNGIVLEIDGVVVDLASLGIDPVYGTGPSVEVTLGQQVKVKNIPQGATYWRKGVETKTTSPLTTVSWKVAKTQNDCFVYRCPYKGWSVYFKFVAA